ncbi:hypothetical protein HaLaN_16751 [Haematococcus lacustris]|uniref:Uncharacterized protein n=1 Tax=Haematococcus lacustris TaxID=44745 RepID=A0A699ZAR5_HAELA|nr:hypothetical protein HaLaN_16751 [Haematococcus lacustris]
MLYPRNTSLHSGRLLAVVLQHRTIVASGGGSTYGFKAQNGAYSQPVMTVTQGGGSSRQPAMIG